MLDIRAALKTILGSSFTVTHAGPAGSVNVTVNVGDAGRDDEKALPAAFILTQFGNSDPSNIGGGGAENRTFCDLSIETVDSDNIEGPLLVKDIHSKIEQLIRASEKTIGSSYYTNASLFRDFPPRTVGGLHVYVRIISVRAINVESY